MFFLLKIILHHGIIFLVEIIFKIKEVDNAEGRKGLHDKVESRG